MARERKTPIPDVVFAFGKRVNKLRLERKMSQMDLGAALGIDRENVRKYEKGLQEPKLSTIVKFVEVFDISFNQLFGYSDSN
ncbi:MAG: transcriptional regulator [Flavobacterium sp.]|nr:MAG: transcriptional regulator [Flavobacterium sp.]